MGKLFVTLFALASAPNKTTPSSCTRTPRRSQKARSGQSAHQHIIKHLHRDKFLASIMFVPRHCTRGLRTCFYLQIQTGSSHRFVPRLRQLELNLINKCKNRNRNICQRRARVLQPISATIPSLQNTCFCQRALNNTFKVQSIEANIK